MVPLVVAVLLLEAANEVRVLVPFAKDLRPGQHDVEAQAMMVAKRHQAQMKMGEALWGCEPLEVSTGFP